MEFSAEFRYVLFQIEFTHKEKGTGMRLLAALLTAILIGSPVLADDAGSVSPDLMKQFESRYNASGDHTAIRNAIANNKLSDLALNRDLIVKDNDYMDLKLKTAGITNQRSSGRCWLFAGLNVFAPDVMTKLNLSEFEFSQTYLTFYDKIEKANLFLEQIIAFRDLPIDDRKMQLVIESPFGDGGWWPYMIGLIQKYGVAPASAMPETKQSISTGTINDLAQRKLRADAAELRQMSRDGKNVKQLRARKDEMLADIYKMMVLAYGQPPKEFDFRYESKDSAAVPVSKTYTPKSFYDEMLAPSMTDYVALMDNPNKPYDKPYKGEWSRNIYENEDLTMLNVPASKLKYYAKKLLLDSQVVWFACDVGKEHCGDSALLQTDIYQYDKIFGTDIKLTKAQRLAFLDSGTNHAMAFAGIDTASDGSPVKWLVENSWGADRGDKGFWYMYDGWFDNYVYVVIVDKAHLDPDDLKNFEQKPEISPMWDPLMKSLKRLD